MLITVTEALRYVLAMALSMTLSKSLSALLDSAIGEFKVWWKSHKKEAAIEIAYA